MKEQSKPNDRINFVVGSELKLKHILTSADVTPLLNAIVRAGADTAIILDEKGKFLWSAGNMPEKIQKTEFKIRDLKEAAENFKLAPLVYEGETIGFLYISIPDSNTEKFLSGLAEIALTGIATTINNTSKRMLATELHTTVVQQSYEELLETNKRLSESEGRYKELAQTLEQKVEEKTAELKNAYARLMQQEKMASIGQLAAGIAHEINNPLGFIHSNLNTFSNYFMKLKEMILSQKAANPGREDMYSKLKIDFILADIPELLKQSMEGAERVKKIVSDLKGFSHIDDAGNAYMDINEEINKTISVLSHESKDRASFIKNYSAIPSFFGSPGLISQMFLNVILNSIQAAKESVRIKITTNTDARNIIITIEDDGPGIPPDVIGRIFEPFYTTKDVGKGTGLGLTVAYDIAKAHGGGISASSAVNQGAIFTIRLPVKEEKNG